MSQTVARCVSSLALIPLFVFATGCSGPVGEWSDERALDQTSADELDTDTASVTQALSCGVLLSGESIARGGSNSSCNGAYRLEVRSDTGVVRLVNAATGAVVWRPSLSDGTAVRDRSVCAYTYIRYCYRYSPQSLQMRTDGNLVVMSKFEISFNGGPWQTGNLVVDWKSGTTVAGSRLAIRDDGKLTIFSPTNVNVWTRP
jgi:hypothetical protein